MSMLLTGKYKFGISSDSGITLNSFKERFVELKEGEVVLPHTQLHLKKEEDNMETLYQIYIVEKDRTVHTLSPVVAKNDEEAKFNAGVYTHEVLQREKLSSVNIIVRNLGAVKVDE